LERHRAKPTAITWDPEGVSRYSLAPTLLCAGLLSACGGASQQPARGGARTAPSPPSGPRDPLDLPAGVPLEPSRAADPDQTKVIRAWAAALRTGDVDGASAAWAVPSKVQNATPVLTLSSRADVRTFNRALPCGSVVTSAGGSANGFTIAIVRLTRRRGARCDAAAGATARIAVRVRNGRIVEWYRLSDDPHAPAPQPAPAPDRVDSPIV
jgi:limonene-1,2-epoxide hydrolase